MFLPVLTQAQESRNSFPNHLLYMKPKLSVYRHNTTQVEVDLLSQLVTNR